MFESIENQLLKNGFSDLEKLKKLNFYSKTWDGNRFDNLELFNKDLFIEFLIQNSNKMKQIQELDLWGFPSNKIEDFLSNISSLEKLENTQGKYPFPKSILLNKNLKALSLSLTPIKTIPKKIKELKKLEILNFSQTDIKELPEEIGELIHLKELNVYNKLTKIHNSILKNINLFKLDFGSNKISELPMGIYNLPNLEYIDISANPIEIFEYNLANWPKLKYLNLSRTPFGIFRENIEKLKAKFPSAEIIGGSNNMFVGDTKFGIYLNCNNLTYK